MNSFQWMIRRYTSADSRLTPAELRRIEQRCNELVTAQQRRFWTVIILSALTTALAAFIGGRMLGPPLASAIGLHAKFGIAVVALLCAIGTMIGWFTIYTRMYVRPLRRTLNELGIAVCEQCGYSLLGLDRGTRRCPECGRPLPDDFNASFP